MSASCYLCGGTSTTARKGAVRDDPSLAILECTACGLVALSSREHISDDHYANSGMHTAVATTMEEWLRTCEDDDQRRFAMLAPALTNSRVLDFGCGAGGFLRKARTVAAEAVGVELERRVREHWAQQIRIHASLAEAGGGYDLITAFHVIEHLPDPRSILQDLAACLAPGGRLILEVPSSQDALLTLYDNEAFQHFTYWSQHLYLFNPETLRQLATQAGVRVIAIQQLQRYSLANHCYWLSKGRPGGHKRWAFLDTPELTRAYAAALAAVGHCDTIIAHVEAS